MAVHQLKDVIFMNCFYSTFVTTIVMIRSGSWKPAFLSRRTAMPLLRMNNVVKGYSSVVT